MGRLLSQKQGLFDAAAVWALLVVIGILGAVVNIVVVYLTARAQRGR